MGNLVSLVQLYEAETSTVLKIGARLASSTKKNKQSINIELHGMQRIFVPNGKRVLHKADLSYENRACAYMSLSLLSKRTSVNHCVHLFLTLTEPLLTY